MLPGQRVHRRVGRVRVRPPVVAVVARAVVLHVVRLLFRHALASGRAVALRVPIRLGGIPRLPVRWGTRATRRWRTHVILQVGCGRQALSVPVPANRLGRVLSMRRRCRRVVWLGAVIVATLELHTLEVAARRRRRRCRGHRGSGIVQSRVNRQRLRTLAHPLVTPLVRTALVGDAHETRRTSWWGGERVCPVERRTARLRRHAVRRLRQVRRYGCLQRMMMMQGRRLRARGSSNLRAFQAPLLRLLDHHVCTCLVGRVVQQTANVVDKQRVQQVGDLFFVGKF